MAARHSCRQPKTAQPERDNSRLEKASLQLKPSNLHVGMADLFDVKQNGIPMQTFRSFSNAGRSFVTSYACQEFCVKTRENMHTATCVHLGQIQAKNNRISVNLLYRCWIQQIKYDCKSITLMFSSSFSWLVCTDFLSVFSISSPSSSFLRLSNRQFENWNPVKSW